jgi:hypothetical protein
VTERLNTLCHELWRDIETHQDAFAEAARNAAKEPKLRRKTRRDAAPFYSALRFDS